MWILRTGPWYARPVVAWNEWTWCHGSFPGPRIDPSHEAQGFRPGACDHPSVFATPRRTPDDQAPTCRASHHREGSAWVLRRAHAGRMVGSRDPFDFVDACVGLEQMHVSEGREEGIRCVCISFASPRKEGFLRPRRARPARGRRVRHKRVVSTFADAFPSRHGLQGRQSARFGRRRVVGTMERLGDGLGDGQVRWNGVFARPNIGQERTDGKRGQDLAQMPLVFGSVETHAVASGRSRGVRARPGSSSWIVQIHRVQSRARPLEFARQAGSHRHGFLNRISIPSSLHGLSRRRVGVRIHDAVHVRIPFPSDPPFRVGSVLLVRWIAMPVSFHAPSTSASTAWHRVDRPFCRLDPGCKRGVPSRKAPSPVVPGTRRLPRHAWDGMGWDG